MLNHHNCMWSWSVDTRTDPHGRIPQLSGVLNEDCDYWQGTLTTETCMFGDSWLARDERLMWLELNARVTHLACPPFVSSILCKLNQNKRRVMRIQYLRHQPHTAKCKRSPHANPSCTTTRLTQPTPHPKPIGTRSTTRFTFSASHHSHFVGRWAQAPAAPSCTQVLMF